MTTNGRKCGLRRETLAILAVLGAATMADLIERVKADTKRASLARSVDNLVKEGLVERNPNGSIELSVVARARRGACETQTRASVTLAHHARTQDDGAA